MTFEFTETAAVSSVEDARAFTLALREIGCHAALDDFGTGFGTFVLLKHLPVDALKIDREFVHGLSTSADDQRIVRSITRIASEAGMQTVAEGVEDAGALALLREYGVGWAQGFHIARPGPLPSRAGSRASWRGAPLTRPLGIDQRFQRGVVVGSASTVPSCRTIR